MSQPVENLDIRPITDPAELDMAARLIVSEIWHDTTQRPSAIQAAKEHFARMDEYQMGAFDSDGQLVGVAGLANGSTLAEKNWALIVDVATASNKQRSGIGSTVMRALHDHARQQGIEETVIVSATKAGASLYKSLGYKWDIYADAYRKKL